MEIDEKQIIDLYITKRKTTHEIAKILNVSQGFVWQFLKKRNLVRTPSEARLNEGVVLPSKSELEAMYLTQRVHPLIIAKKYGVSRSVIGRLLKKYKVSIRSASEANLKSNAHMPTQEELQDWYLVQGLSVLKIGKLCNIDPSTIADYLKKYGITARKGIETRLFKSYVPSKKELEQWYLDEHQSTIKIAKICRVTKGSVARWLKKYGIPIRKGGSRNLKKDAKFPIKQELQDLYVKKGFSICQIANMYNISDVSISNLLKRYRVESRTSSETRLFNSYKPTRTELIGWYLNDKLSSYEIALSCGVASTSVIRWLKEYNIPIRASLFGYTEKLVCKDGHMVNSTYERVVDNWLFYNGISHQVGVRISKSKTDPKSRTDFKIGQHWVEIWGLAGKEFYDIKTIEVKLPLYQKLGFQSKLIEIYPADFKSHKWKQKLNFLITLYAKKQKILTTKF
ncbi:MAG: hypothetical protein ABIG20_03220 [archaeon]